MDSMPTDHGLKYISSRLGLQSNPFTLNHTSRWNRWMAQAMSYDSRRVNLGVNLGLVAAKKYGVTTRVYGLREV